MVSDAALLTALLNDSLVAAEHESAATLDSLVTAYEEALETSFVTPRERDTVVKQIRKMALFHRAYEKHKHVAAEKSVGMRIDILATRLSATVPGEDTGVRLDETMMEVATQVMGDPTSDAVGERAKPRSKRRAGKAATKPATQSATKARPAKPPAESARKKK